MKKAEENKKTENQTEDELVRFGLYIKQSTLDLAKEYVGQADCRNVSQLISKVILFYVECLASEKCENILPLAVTNALQDMIRESNNKQGRMMFKLAVELSVLANVIASQQGIPEASMDRLRGICVNEVKKINGSISYEDAVRWQS